jgi:WD40 repeat protein
MLAAMPDALPGVIFNRLRAAGWTAAQITGGFLFGDAAPTLRLREVLGAGDVQRRGLTRHRAPVLGVSPHDTQVLSWSADGLVICWDVSSGAMRWWLGAHPNLVAACSTPDHTQLVTAGRDGSLAGWNVEGRAELRWETAPTGSLVTALVPDDRGTIVCAGSADGSIRIIDLTTGRVANELSLGAAQVTCLGSAPTANCLLIASADGVVRWHDLASRRESWRASAHRGRVTSVDLHGGDVISTGADGCVRRWSGDGQPMGEWLVHPRGACGGLFDARANVAVLWALDGTVAAWHGSDGTVVTMSAGHAAAVEQCVLVPQRDRRTGRAVKGVPRIVSCSSDGTVALWRADDGDRLARLDEHVAPVKGCVETWYSGEIVSWDEDGTLLAWRAQSDGTWRAIGGVARESVPRLHVVDGPAVVFSIGSEITSTSAGALGGERASPAPTVLPWTPSGVAASRSGRLFLAWTDEGRLACDGLRGRFVDVTHAGLTGARRVAGAILDHSHRRRALVWHRDGTVSIWRAERGRVTRVGTHTGRVVAAGWLGGGRAVTASWDGTLLVVDVEHDLVERVLRGHQARVLGCVVADDGETVASWSDDSTVRLWSAIGSDEPVSVVELPQRPAAVAFVSDDAMVIGTAAGSLHLWQPDAGRLGDAVHAHAGGVTGIVQVESYDQAARVVSCGEDAVVRLWRAGGTGLEQEAIAFGVAPFRQIVQIGAVPTDPEMEATLALGRPVAIGAAAVALADEAGNVWVFDVGPAPRLVATGRGEPIRLKRSKSG